MHCSLGPEGPFRVFENVKASSFTKVNCFKGQFDLCIVLRFHIVSRFKVYTSFCTTAWAKTVPSSGLGPDLFPLYSSVGSWFAEVSLCVSYSLPVHTSFRVILDF